MAMYKFSQYIVQNSDAAFDNVHSPAAQVPLSGIYRCMVCGREIAANAFDPFPPQNHDQHPAGQPIQWKLIVWADHNPK